MSRFVRRFSEIGLTDLPLVGGKNASLGEMYGALSTKGIAVPDGFAITADAYRHFVAESGLGVQIASALTGLDPDRVDELRQRGAQIRSAILAARLPADLEQAILAAYRDLAAEQNASLAVAVRTSATAEDLPGASFAGQYETYLNVRGEPALLDACRRSYASLFTDRAISYRTQLGFDHEKIALSIGVQRMVRADVGASGVMFTIDTESGFRDAILISAAYGLGENVVQGAITPDEFVVFKPTLQLGFRPILRRKLGEKQFRLVYADAAGGGPAVQNVPVPHEERARFAIGDDDILTLARWGCAIEQHYSERRGEPSPMDIEWAKDGVTGQLFIVQARPETVQSRRSAQFIEKYSLRQKAKVLAQGRSVGAKIGRGPVRVIDTVEHLHDFRDGEVLVADKTDPDWEPIMKRAAAIVTNRGGRTCHAAIISRELGVPAVVGTENATAVLANGRAVTVSCAEGETGSVYDGSLAYDVERIDVAGIERPRTSIMMNVANPDEAFSLSFLPNDGVGLAREEFIISNTVKIHPMALLEYGRVDDSAARAEIDRLTAGYDDKSGYFVDRLAEGVAMIAAAFYPKDVIVRLSDFKTNEYANLIGGRAFEPTEENPMLGFRGASRYYDPLYRDGFALECRAMRKVRQEMGLRNVKLMIPFCRTVEEGRRVEAEMARHGLRRGEDGLEIYVMCEIPSNVLNAEEFAEIFDGFSIGSNDLTQLTLGVDRDSSIVAHDFDERDPAVKKLIAAVIRVAKSRGRKIGICGQAPSDYPEFARFLVEEGIDSISLNPDAILKTTLAVLETERELAAAAGSKELSTGPRAEAGPSAASTRVS